MHIGYVPRERPPFSALNFRSGAYNFHKLPKKNPFRTITILHFLADFAVPETIIFKISLISTRSFASRRAAQRVSSRPERQPDASGSSGDSHFHAQNGSSSFRSPRIFKLKIAEPRSGAPHFHALDRQLVAEPGPIFHFAAAHYLPKFGVSYPPPHPPPPPPPPGCTHINDIHMTR